LTAGDCERLIGDGVATGGMQAKLNAAADALRNGISEVVIAPGGAAGAIGRLLAGETLGTRIVSGGDHAHA
jgi:acetylglutamate kinase